jgi:hypothetical protein
MDYLGSGEAVRISDSDFAEELSAMERRCRGLEIAVAGIGREGDKMDLGVNQLVSDVADAMARLAAAFEVETQMRSPDLLQDRIERARKEAQTPEM